VFEDIDYCWVVCRRAYDVFRLACGCPTEGESGLAVSWTNTESTLPLANEWMKLMLLGEFQVRGFPDLLGYALLGGYGPGADSELDGQEVVVRSASTVQPWVTTL
jgi:hypothetical protein